MRRKARAIGRRVCLGAGVVAVTCGVGMKPLRAGAWTTLNVAYVDERRELFAFAPERALLGARSARDLRMLGVLNDTEMRYKKQRSWEFDVEEQGWRYHMSDLMAAIGRVQLGRFQRDPV